MFNTRQGDNRITYMVSIVLNKSTLLLDTKCPGLVHVKENFFNTGEQSYHGNNNSGNFKHCSDAFLVSNKYPDIM